MSIPDFLKTHRTNAEENSFFSDQMSNPNKARVWIAEVRNEHHHDDRYALFGKALYWELRNRRRASVINQLRGAYNRARGHVEHDQLKEYIGAG